MTSFRRPTTLKSFVSWLEIHPEITLPLLFFILVWFLSGWLGRWSGMGLSDDEAYYWVLSRKLSLSYAFHPPAAPWMIALFEKIFSPFLGQFPVALVRLPAVLSTSVILGLGLRWLKSFGVSPKDRWKSSGVFFSFFGFFALSWMMVPDIPLFLGWTLVFVLSSEVSFENGARSHFKGVLIFLGCLLATVSKYSGFLVGISAAFSFWFLAPKKSRVWGMSAALLGVAVGLIPILIWNSQNHWASILYQIKDRHHGEFSWASLVRYGRFWVAQLLLAGPLTVASFFYLFKSARNHKLARYILVWAFPPASVYLIQPLYADFKLHWAFIVWWPVVLWLAMLAPQKTGNGILPRTEFVLRALRIQNFYGWIMGGLVLLACHLPIFTWMGLNQNQDVTNDLYGWEDLRQLKLDQGAKAILGGWYQTAAQAAFVFDGPVAYIPRSDKERREWPELDVTDSSGPEWPRLKSEVLFVSTNRYSGEPEFKDSQCTKFDRRLKMRFGKEVGWIDLWRCRPNG